MIELPSPPARRVNAPSWFNPRVALGILLIAVAVAGGARIVAAADRSVRVWALTRDVAAGTVLVAGDVEPARARLFDAAPLYLRTVESPAGRSVSRELRAGELLPAAALRTAAPAAVVAVPVSPQNAPLLARGQSVDVWATVKGCPPARVLAGVPVQAIRAERSGALSVAGSSIQVVLRVAPAEAARLVTALGAEAVIRLVVLDGVTDDRSPVQPVRCSARGTAAGGGS